MNQIISLTPLSLQNASSLIQGTEKGSSRRMGAGVQVLGVQE